MHDLEDDHTPETDDPATSDRQGEDAGPHRPALSRRRRLVYALIATIVIPALLLVAAELGLWLFGYGYPTQFLLPTDSSRTAYTGNAQFGWRFFPRALSRTPAMMYLPAEKGDNVVRIFVLGGSAAQGEPGPAFSVGRFLQAMLEAAYPNTRFEVVNAAMTAINSHVVLPIARDCAQFEPDIFIIYMGNNEVVGPYGAGTIFATYSPKLSMIRAGLWVKTTRLGQLVDAISTRVTRRQEPPARWRGLEMFMSNRLPADDPQLQTVYRHFRRNLADIIKVGVRAEVKTIVSTVAVNLADCPPFASVRRGLSESDQAAWDAAFARGVEQQDDYEHEQAIAQFRRAIALDGGHAESHYRLAQCHAALGDTTRADEEFALAGQLDALRFRADERINRIIREVASRRENDGVFLIDAAALLADRNGRSAQQRDAYMFYEHVHFRPEGNYALAEILFPVVVQSLPASVRRQVPDAPAAPSFQQCSERLALTGWNRHAMLKQIHALGKRPPFVNQFDHQARQAARLVELDELGRHASDEGRDAAAKAYHRAINNNGDDLFLHDTFAKLQLDRRRYDSAMEHCRSVLQRLPEHITAHGYLAAALAGAGQFSQAQEQFERYFSASRYTPPLYRAKICNEAARISASSGRLTEALAYCRRALKILPNDPESLMLRGQVESALEMHHQALKTHTQALEHAPEGSPLRAPIEREMGRVLFQLYRVEGNPQRLHEAIRHLQTVVELDPEAASAIADMAMAFTMLQDLDRADRFYRRSLQIRPLDVDVRCAYANLLEMQGRPDEAVAQYRLAVEAAPRSPKALNGLAWLLATSSDPSLRDPLEAVRLAETAASASRRPPPQILDTLAAAYASAEQFDKAVTVARQAIAAAGAIGRSDLAPRIRERLELYRDNKPFLWPPEE